MILAFIIDTAAQMNQLTASGRSIITVAKSIAISILRLCQPTDKVAVFTCESSGAMVLLNQNDAEEYIQSIEATSVADTQELVQNAVNCIHEYLLYKECDTFSYGRYRQLSIPVTYVLISTAISLQVTVSSFDYIGSDYLESPFRWDQQFHAYIIHSPVLSNSLPLEVKDCPLQSLCASTRGQVFNIDSLSASLSANNQLFFSSPTGSTIDKTSKASFYPSIMLVLDKQALPQNYLKNLGSLPEFMQEITNQEGLSFLLPLIPAESSSFQSFSQEERINRFFYRSSDSHFIYPYPEQSKPRNRYPSFRMRLIHEVIPGLSLLNRIKKAQLPYDLIVIRLDEIQESAKPYMHLLSDIFQCCSSHTTNIRPYFQGEDNHTYGAVLDGNDSFIKILFFTPDFPLLEERMGQKDIPSVIQWIQTIPLEYVPSIYTYLQSLDIVIPFPCPSLPSRKQISLKDKVQIRILE